MASEIGAIAPQGKSILDVGTGNGRLAKAILRHRPDLLIVGLDVNTCSSSESDVIVFDGNTLPFDTGSWDICMANDVLHHCDSPLNMLSEMERVARDFLIIKDHFADSHVDSVLLSIMDWVGNYGYGTRVPFNFLSSTQWNAAFKTLNLTPTIITTTLHLYPRPFTWLFDRKLHFLTLLEVNKEEVSPPPATSSHPHAE